jgi:hypothetical protein
MTHTILAFDPGETTGYCEIEVLPDGSDFKVVYCREILWHERLQKLREVLYFRNSVDVVIESFRLFPHKAKAQIGSQFPSVRVIGTIEAYCYTNNLGPEVIKFQEPGDISRVAVLEPHIPVVAGSPHKIDAYRHARLYFIKHYTLNPFK